jgi:hypothetical protein
MVRSDRGGYCRRRLSTLDSPCQCLSSYRGHVSRTGRQLPAGNVFREGPSTIGIIIDIGIPISIGIGSYDDATLQYSHMKGSCPAMPVYEVV